MKIKFILETWKLKKLEEELQALQKCYGVKPGDPGKVHVRFEGTEEEGQRLSTLIQEYFIREQQKWN